MYTLQCNVQCAGCNVHSTVEIIHYTLYTVHDTLYTVHDTLYTVHYTLYTVLTQLQAGHYTCFLGVESWISIPLPAPYSLPPIPCFLLPAPYSLLTTPCCQLWKYNSSLRSTGLPARHVLADESAWSRWSGGSGTVHCTGASSEGSHWSQLGRWRLSAGSSPSIGVGA